MGLCSHPLEKTWLPGAQQEVYIKGARSASTELCNSFFTLLREPSRWNYLAVMICRYAPLAVVRKYPSISSVSIAAGQWLIGRFGERWPGLRFLGDERSLLSLTLSVPPHRTHVSVSAPYKSGTIAYRWVGSPTASGSHAVWVDILPPPCVCANGLV